MRQWIRSALVGAAMVATMAIPARAQGFGAVGGGYSEFGIGPPAPGPLGPTPTFSSPFGGSQGYGYYPATFWPGPGAPLNFKTHYDVTVSTPYRPGSIVYYPPVGYFVMGSGPYLFHTGR